MNILIYIADTSPSGISRYAQNISVCLSRYNHNCIIVADNNLYNKQISNNYVLLSKNKLKGSEIIKRVFLLKKEVEKNKIDIIISNGWYHDMISLMASKLSKNKPKVIGVVHLRPELWNLNKWYGRIKNIVIKKIYRMEDFTIIVSNELNQLLKEKGYVHNTKVIYNPVVSEYIKNISKVRKITNSVSNSEVKLCCMGWIKPIKGFDIAIKALAEINNKFPASLTIIGASADDSYYSELKNLIYKLDLEKMVFFTGPLENPYLLLDKMDIFLLTSRSEVLPTALIEAMSIGLPVIACDCDFGPREIIKNYINGILVPVDDYNSIAKSVIELINNSELYVKLSENAVKESNKYTFEKIGQEYNKVINLLANKHK